MAAPPSDRRTDVVLAGQRNPLQPPLSQALLYDMKYNAWCLGGLGRGRRARAGIAIVARSSGSRAPADGPTAADGRLGRWGRVMLEVGVMFDILGTAESWSYRPVWVPVVPNPVMVHYKPFILAHCVTAEPLFLFPL